MAQAGGLTVAPGIVLPMDSVKRTVLMSSLRGWLASAKGPDSLNEYVALADRPVTGVLMGQLRGLKADCYLGAVTSLDSLHWQIQLNYMSPHSDTPVLQACCTVLARLDRDRFFISSPLRENTVGWKSRTIGCCTFHYKTGINKDRATEFERTVVSYDKRLKIQSPVIDYYCCDNFMEAAKLVGIDYMSRYSGFGFADLSDDYGRRSVIVAGNEWKDGFCPVSMHDMWHGELHKAVSVKVINRPVDEGTAYLYGGSWIVYSWKDILTMMKEYALQHPGADWRALYKDGVNLIPPPKIIKISYIINALIVQRLEKEKGFTAALPILCCGPKEPGDANYFAAVEKTTGVDEAGFNGYIDGLIKDALY